MKSDKKIFIVKDMDIATGGTKIAILNQKDAVELDLHHMDRILIRKAGVKKTVAVLDIAESEKAVPPGSIGLFEETLKELNAKSKDIVRISIEKKPVSVSYIKKKMDGGELSYDEILSVIEDIVKDNLTDIELTAFICANYTNGMSMKEIGDLTKAMTVTGNTLHLRNKKIVDMHCIGGVPGNRTTLIVVPILAAAGLIIPKTSSRAITSPAGTADTMEVLCKVTIPIPRLYSIIRRVGGFIIWGGAINLAPADDKIINIEHPISIDAEGQMLASIMAKKASVSATHVLIDIPVGKGAKTKNMKEAMRLKRKFEELGKKIGIKVKAVITDGSQPIGNGIGPSLEARDALWLLKNDPRGPADLKEKSIDLAGTLLEFAGVAKRGKGRIKANNILFSGDAYKKFIQMIKAQGGFEMMPDHLKLGDYTHTIYAKKKGRVKKLSNHKVMRIARLAGTPRDKGAGIYLYRHKGDNVEKGEKLFTIYAHNKEKLKFALDYHKTNGCYTVK